MTESPVCPKKSREKLTSLVFESLNAPAFCVAATPVLSFYCSGRTCGLCVEVGYGVTHSVPIYEGHVMPHGIQTLEVGGSTLTGFLAELLKSQEDEIDKPYYRSTVEEIKEKLGFFAMNYDDQCQAPVSSYEKSFPLPDGQVITVGKERFQCTEGLFNPEKLGLETSGIHEKVLATVNRCDVDHRSQFWPNIVVAGGTTLLPGFIERMRKEMIATGPASMRINVVSMAERGIAAWIGGSIMGCLSTFPKQWISKEEYDENGAYIVNRRCF